MEAAILITHAEDGTATVARTADHHGRKGVEWGGGSVSASVSPRRRCSRSRRQARSQAA